MKQLYMLLILTLSFHILNGRSLSNQGTPFSADAKEVSERTKHEEFPEVNLNYPNSTANSQIQYNNFNEDQNERIDIQRDNMLFRIVVLLEIVISSIIFLVFAVEFKKSHRSYFSEKDIPTIGF